MDPSIAAAIAAVAIAVLAFVVAFTQVLQQYLMTGSLLRLCDKTVYGMLPGRGRRIWQTDQFRFRVVYTLPQLRLERGIWEDGDDDQVELHEYPDIDEWPDWKRPPPGGIWVLCTNFRLALHKALQPINRLLRSWRRRCRLVIHRSLQTSVAQRILRKCPSFSRRRMSTKYRGFLSSFQQFIRGRMAML